jgi:hypothetical protein
MPEPCFKRRESWNKTTTKPKLSCKIGTNHKCRINSSCKRTEKNWRKGDSRVLLRKQKTVGWRTNYIFFSCRIRWWYIRINVWTHKRYTTNIQLTFITAVDLDLKLTFTQKVKQIYFNTVCHFLLLNRGFDIYLGKRILVNKLICFVIQIWP